MRTIKTIVQTCSKDVTRKIHVHYANDYDIGGAVEEYRLKKRENVAFAWFHENDKAVLNIIFTNVYILVDNDSLEKLFEKGVNTKNFTIFDPEVVTTKKGNYIRFNYEQKEY